MFLEEKREFKPVAPATLEPWQQRILDAADLLECEGWCQNLMSNTDGKKCAVEAIRMSGSRIYDKVAIKAARKLAHSLGIGMDGPTIWTITRWNDAEGRTASEVIARMRSCALE